MSPSPLDLLVVGAGPAGMLAAIRAAEAGLQVRVLEAQPKPGRKLLASGGGRCNLTNTLPVAELAGRFAGARRFVRPALEALPPDDLRAFFAGLGVATHAPDGRRVFPTDHRAASVHRALLTRLQALAVRVATDQRVEALLEADGAVVGVRAGGAELPARAVLLACGGRGYPALGGSKDGYALARQAGHRVVEPTPAMVPLRTREDWPARCTSHTLGQVTIEVEGLKGPGATGDLIFEREGIAGPVVLDLARELGRLLAQRERVGLRINATGERDGARWQQLLREAQERQPRTQIGEFLRARLPPPLVEVVCEQAGTEPGLPLAELPRRARNLLAEHLAWLRLEVVATAGWDHAMVTRGGVARSEIEPATLASRLRPGLFFAGELIDVDGPCGGFNLQWAFASGELAGRAASRFVQGEGSP